MSRDLTDTRARAIKPGDPNLPIGGVTGLVLQPTKRKGRGSWRLRFVSPVSGKRRDMGCGTYPEISVAAARKAGLDYRNQIAAGLDPLEERRKAQLERRDRSSGEDDAFDPSEGSGPPTFAAAARAVHDSKREGFRNPKHAAQ